MIEFVKRFGTLFFKVNRKSTRYLLTSQETKRAVILYTTQVFGILFAFISQKINTNFLNKEEFGVVTWCTQLLILLHPLFEFGYFLSGTRMLAASASEIEKRRIYGLLITFLILIALSFSVCLCLASTFFTSLFHDEITRKGMLVSSSLAWAYVVQFFLQTVLQGSGDVSKLSLFTVLSRFLTAVSLLLWVWLGSLDVYTSLLLSMGAMALSGIYVLYKLKPIFMNWRHYIPEIQQQNKEYGWHIYIGKLVSVPTFQLAPVMIPYFSTISSSAIYAVGSSLIVPMVQATQSISMTLFKNFTQQKKLKDRLIVINVVVLITIGTAIYIFAPFLINLSSNETFQQVVPYMLPLVLGGFFQGLWQPFHQFALARGKGQWMKHQLIFGAVSDTILTLILVPLFGLEGACWQFFLGRFVRFFFTLYNYYRTVVYLKGLRNT